MSPTSYLAAPPRGSPTVVTQVPRPSSLRGGSRALAAARRELRELLLARLHPDLRLRQRVALLATQAAGALGPATLGEIAQATDLLGRERADLAALHAADGQRREALAA